jgi:hypothetical protein
MPPESTTDPIVTGLMDALRRMGRWPHLKPYHSRFRCLECQALLKTPSDDNHYANCPGQDIAEALRILAAREAGF